jgi:hypothetical protein
MASFGDKYKTLIDSNPNKKSISNTNPGVVQGATNSKNPYSGLILSTPSQKSLFNTNPGVEFGAYNTKNPYVNLISKWNFTKITPSAPFIGRSIVAPLVDVYYVIDGYVDEDYVEVQQAPAY